GQSRASRGALTSLADGFNKYTTMVASTTAAVTGLVLSLKSTIDYSKELDDKLADVRKTTSLTAYEVEQLDGLLSKLGTRTSRMDLLSFAEEGGRLGYDNVEELYEFVDAANKISVALGPDFRGNVEETIRTMGKLAEQYQVGADIGASVPEAMQMIGSAINEVGMAGSNTAPFLVDYLKRMVGISAQAKISAQDTIGFAAALDEAGQTAEVSGTVMSNLVTKLFKKTGDFAKAANMDLGKFSKLLDNDVNEALLVFFENINATDGGLAEFVENIDGLGIDGQRATGVLATLAANVDKIRQRQMLANQALRENTSLQDEYNIKNENFAATVEKLQKRILGFIADNALTRWTKDMIMLTAGLLGVTEDADGTFEKYRNRIKFVTQVVVLLVTATLSYIAALKL
ncbi:MAG: phage tail tape measure protein, partial [Oceanicaulis sp.]|nr:phage tail tape measure protein [Oceanicaulis sp.]